MLARTKTHPKTEKPNEKEFLDCNKYPTDKKFH